MCDQAADQWPGMHSKSVRIKVHAKNLCMLRQSESPRHRFTRQYADWWLVKKGYREASLAR